jgi:hypothetical protein
VSIQTRRELEATRDKLRTLEEYYDSTGRKEGLNAHAREAILHSTKRMINQLKEEITRFEAHLASGKDR